MRKNAEKVLQAFAKGKPCNGKTISTDGMNLYSYKMLIARTNNTNGIDLLDYSQAPSATTRSHIRAVEYFYPKGIDSRVESFESVPTTLKYWCDSCGESYKLVPPQKPFKCHRRGCKGVCS